MLKVLQAILIPALISTSSQSYAVENSVPVNVLNFPRAETDHYMAKYVAQGGFGKLIHTRVPVPIEQQDVIRMNRDTLYSGGVFDVTTPVSITMPEGDGRFQSLLVINQDHYVVSVEHDPGTYTVSMDDADTQYVVAIIRTFMDPGSETDIAAANRMQDQLRVHQESKGEFDVPDWDMKSLDSVRGLLNALAAGAPGEMKGMFGSKDEVDPIRHLIASAAGWGGNPEHAAVYANHTPEKNDGKVPHAVTVKDVPVDGFWSLTVYNEDGFMEKNEQDVYSFNGVTAQKNDDGSITLHFGACSDGRLNCIPVTKGWNYIVRLYQPRQAILDGSWVFPEAAPVQ